MFRWLLSALTRKYRTNKYNINETYKNISVTTDVADVALLPSGNASSSVVCFERKNAQHSVTVKDGTLVIELPDTAARRKYFKQPKITLYIPQGTYGTLSVKSNIGNTSIADNHNFESIDIVGNTGNVHNHASASCDIRIKTCTGNIGAQNISSQALDLCVLTGGINVSNITCTGDANIHVSTGKINLVDLKCQNISATGSTGDVSLKNVIATKDFSIERRTGDIRLDACDAANISIKNSTGDITGSLLSDKVFTAQTRIGDIKVPKTTTGGNCKIAINTGDIKIKIC